MPVMSSEEREQSKHAAPNPALQLGGLQADGAAAARAASDPAGIANVNWADLVERVARGENAALEELYRIFARGVRYFLCRQLGAQELDDKVHDTFLIVVQAIQRGDLREPERLMGFVRTIVRRQVAAYIDEMVHTRKEELDLEVGGRVPDKANDPEQSMAFRQRVELMKSVLQQLSERDREILTRFYLHEQTQEEICQDMNLSETQFRLLKSRAKSRFGELGRKKIHQRALMSLFMRTSVGISH